MADYTLGTQAGADLTTEGGVLLLLRAVSDIIGKVWAAFTGASPSAVATGSGLAADISGGAPGATFTGE
jgi:hypothetical protein